MPKPKKPSAHRAIEADRKKRAPKVGAAVEYPVPLPPISADDDGLETVVPTGDESWYPAKVKSVERVARSTEPDGYIAALETPHGIGLSLSVLFLRAKRKRKR